MPELYARFTDTIAGEEKPIVAAAPVASVQVKDWRPVKRIWKFGEYAPYPMLGSKRLR